MSDKLKHEFETETAQGISYNEGVVDADENGTYNDEYVHWLERKMEAIQTKQLLPKHLSNIAYTVAKGNSYDGFVNWWNEQKVGNEDRFLTLKLIEMELLKQFAERIDNDNGYDNLTMAKDLIQIAKEFYDKQQGNEEYEEKTDIEIEKYVNDNKSFLKH
jgi:hypothetical protein